MKFLKGICVVAMLGLSLHSLTASANTISLNGVSNIGTEDLYAFAPEDQDFMHFVISASSANVNAIFDLDLSPGYDLSAFSVSLFKDGNLTAIQNSGAITNYTYNGSLAAGSYYFLISALSTPAFSLGIYNYNVSISAVPEPNTSALIFMGLAMLGFCIKRKA